MMNLRQEDGARFALWAAVIVVAALAGLTASSVEAQPSPCGGVDPPCENWMSVGYAGPASVGDTVDIDVSIDVAETPYQAYQAVIEYDSAIVLFSSLVWPSCPIECWTDEDVGGGLRRTDVSIGYLAPRMDEGVVGILRYECVGPGEAILRLVPPEGGTPWTGSTTYDSASGVIPTGLAGGLIVCQAPTPTPTDTPTVTPTPTRTMTPTPTVTPTQPPCIDWFGDTSCEGPTDDADNDGCTDAQEAALGDAFRPDAWYDVYDVPVPAKADADGANGSRNKTVDMGDVLAVLFYAFADNDGPPNASGVDYDSLKGWDLNGDSIDDIGAPPGIEEGLKYDRSPGLPPSGDTGLDPAGPPNGAMDTGDVLAVLAQAFAIDCTAS